MESLNQNINVVVSAVIIDQNNKVLLGKSPKWKNKWTIPGGKIKNGETMSQALRREIMEETGLIIDHIKLLNISESIFDKDFKDGNNHMIFIDFVCNPQNNEVKIDHIEFIEYKWYNINTAVNELSLSINTKNTLLKLIN